MYTSQDGGSDPPEGGVLEGAVVRLMWFVCGRLFFDFFDFFHLFGPCFGLLCGLKGCGCMRLHGVLNGRWKR